MKAITVRDIPKDVQEMIEKRAKAKGLSLTRATIDLLLDRTGVETRVTRRIEYDDLDELAGSWTRAEAARFERETRLQRRVDEDIWR